jgi:hypothetical protein
MKLLSVLLFTLLLCSCKKEEVVVTYTTTYGGEVHLESWEEQPHSSGGTINVQTFDSVYSKSFEITRINDSLKIDHGSNTRSIFYPQAAYGDQVSIQGDGFSEPSFIYFQLFDEDSISYRIVFANFGFADLYTFKGKESI